MSTVLFPGESAAYRQARAAGQHPRHVDLLWPLWNLLDLTPGGRGIDWTPRLEEPLVQFGKAS